MKPLFNQAVQFFQTGQLNAAQATLLKVTATDPTHHSAFHLLGIIASQQGNFELAISHIKKAIALSNSPANYLENLGNVHQAAQNWSAAEETWHLALKKNSTSADIMYKLGLAAIAQKRKELAKTWWRKALSANSTHVDSLINMGMLQNEEDDYKGAMSYWKQAWQMTQNNGRLKELMTNAQVEYGKQEMISGHYLSAEKEFKAACKRSPKVAEAWGLLADSQLKIGKVKKAFDACKRAISIEPENPVFHHNMGNIFRTSGQLDSALEAYERSQRLGSSHAATKQAIAALRGDENADHSPEATAALFDQYAGQFDAHLVETLQYSTPAKLFELCQPYIHSTQLDSILDLGCGTGLSIAPFIEISKQRIGVDISSQMLSKAREKNIYSNLHVAEIEEFLNQSNLQHDLILCVDTLVYMKHLSTVFSLIRTALKPKGLFVCSTEHSAGEAATLLSSGRFAHSTAYVLEAARSAGLKVLKNERSILRQDANKGIEGDCWIFQTTPL